MKRVFSMSCILMDGEHLYRVIVIKLLYCKNWYFTSPLCNTAVAQVNLIRWWSNGWCRTSWWCALIIIVLFSIESPHITYLWCTRDIHNYAFCFCKCLFFQRKTWILGEFGSGLEYEKRIKNMQLIQKAALWSRLHIKYSIHSKLYFVWPF
jgi:hypothetical protein